MHNKVAVISDIHANYPALKAIVEDIEKHNITTVLNLGDSLYGPLYPKKTFKLISEKDFISISGNQDRFILENWNQGDESNSTLAFVLKSLPREAFNWIKTLDNEHIHKNIYMCHGNFEQDNIPLIEKFHNDKVVQKSYKELEKETENVQQDIILCGHTHVPKILRLSNSNRFVINPGSVGLPAYDDNMPFYHKMESDSPLAKYSIIAFKEKEVVAVTQQQVHYDYKQAATQAEKNGRLDWAYWIKNGRVK